ncbi:MAG: CZB domain-containing protein [Zoogloeaceae bacterium]|nr:CZB domain-containing protein [Zoogloeaceae bacterium]
MNLDTAIGKHAEWKVKLRSAIARQETLDAESIAKDNCCELGKWLHSEAKEKYAAMHSYSPCVETHAAFHLEAGKVAAMINARKYSEAEAMLGSGSAYSKASTAVASAIMRLTKEVKR